MVPSMRRLVFPTAAALLVLACAPRQPAQVPKARQYLGDLSEVAEPATLVGFVRARSPEVTASNGLRLLGLSEPTRRRLLALLQPPTLRSTDLKSPVEVAFSLPPKEDDFSLQWALSWPLEDLEQGRKQLEALGATVSSLSPGLYAITLDEPERSALLGEQKPEVTAEVAPTADTATTTDTAPATETPTGETPEATEPSEPTESAPFEGEPTEESDSSEHGPLLCHLGEAIGQAPARLVCSKSPEALQALSGWLRRTTPRQVAPQQDLQGEVRFTPLWTRWGAELRIKAAAAGAAATIWLSMQEGVDDPELRALPAAVMLDALCTLQDLERLSFTLGLDPQSQQLTGEVSLQLRGETSWLGKWVGSQVRHAGPAPAALWRLPRETENVAFGRTGEPEQLAPLARILGSLTRWGSQKLESSPPHLAEELSALVETLFSTSDQYLFAHGRLPGPDLAALWASLPKDGSPTAPPVVNQELVRDAVDAYVGWTLIGLNGPAQRSEDWLRRLASTYALVQETSRAEDSDHSWQQAASKLVQLTVLESPAGFPPGSKALELSATLDHTWLSFLDSKVANECEQPPCEVADPVRPLFHVGGMIVVVPRPEGGHWVAWSSNVEALAKVVATTASQATSSQLASLAGLETLREPQLVSGAFGVPGPELQSQAGLLTQVGPEILRQLAARLSTVPHRLQTPIVSTSVGKVDKGSLRWSFRSVVARETMQDLASLAQFLEANEAQLDAWLKEPTKAEEPSAPTADLAPAGADSL
jgi:hypothetical protein